MRLVAFSLLVSAAFDWPIPFLDRAGLAALGFACLALSLGRLAPRFERVPVWPARGDRAAASELGDDPMIELRDRIASYTSGEPAS